MYSNHSKKQFDVVLRIMTMFSRYPNKTMIKSLQDFDHLSIDPVEQSIVMRQYESYKSMIRYFHKNYFVVQKEHTLAKEQLKYQQDLVMKLRRKHEKLMQDKRSKESVVQMCRDRIIQEESLLKEYQTQCEQITNQNVSCEDIIIRAKSRIEVIVAKEVSTFEELKQQQKVVMYLAQVTREQVRDVGLSRFEETFQLLEQIEKRETQKVQFRQ